MIFGQYRSAWRPLLFLWLGIGALVIGCRQRDSSPLAGSNRETSTDSDGRDGEGAKDEARTDVTFARDVAPLVFAKCGGCHRPSGAAPFSLLTYAEVRDRAQQIAEVTASRYMPPWLPAAGKYQLKGERRLTDQEVALFRRWCEQGSPEGNRNDMPPLPHWPDGWSLGPPDLVVEMAEPYIRRAGTEDVWRNFVMPVTIDRPRFVQVVDFLPGNARAIHHAIISVDTTGNARQLDQRDPAVGYEAMRDGVLGIGQMSGGTGGLVIGWLPGKLPDRDDVDQIWQLQPGSDLVLQLHMPPAGKDESIQSRIGLYFTDVAPRHITESIYLSDREIDIPPDRDDYIIEQAYTFPVDVDLVQVYPHAHYLGKEMKVQIRFPDGRTDPLLYIPEWNFDWQDDYRFVNPVHLPRGSEIRIRYRFDNTGANPRNPYEPPRRVLYGEKSDEEMGDLLVHFRVRSEADRQQFRKDYLQYQFQLSLSRHQKALAREPSNPREHVRVGEALTLVGRFHEAGPYFEKAIALDPSYAIGHARCAMMKERGGDLAGAIAQLEKAIQLDPDDADHRKQIAQILFKQGETTQMTAQLEHYVRLRPGDGKILAQLGGLLGSQGRVDESLAMLERAVRAAPHLPAAHLNLGITLRKRGDVQRALVHLTRAAELAPQDRQIQAVLQATRGSKRPDPKPNP